MPLSNRDSPTPTTTSHINNDTETNNEQHLSSSSSSPSAAITPTKKTEIEIEQKFALPTATDVTAIEIKLRSLGYHLEKKEVFVDWYFDLPSPLWYLTPNDCWLRYRQRLSNNGDDDDDEEEEEIKGEWQYKRRPVVTTAATTTTTGRNEDGISRMATVYEELTGVEAIDAAMAVIHNRPTPMDNSDVDDDDADVTMTQDDEDNHFTFNNNSPTTGLPKDSGLVPFAKFETRRSKWIMTQGDDENHVVTVDIDGTDFGYMVGEVEIIVHNEDDIDEARERIEAAIAEIIGRNGKEDKMDNESDDDGGGGGREEGVTTTAIGKLQTYMVKHCRAQYDKCVNAGSL